MNKLSVTITGDVDDLTKFLKAFNGKNYANNIDVKTNPISSNFKNNILTKTKYSYNYYSDNPNYSNSILRHLIFRDKEDNWANFYFDKDIKQVRIVINYQDGTIYSRIDNY